jgi:CpXC protein
MPNSFAQLSQLTCENCQREFDGEVWFLIDIAQRPDLTAAISNGVLHTFTCPHCGRLQSIDAPLLIYRPSSTKPLLFSPAEQTTITQNQEHLSALIDTLHDQLGAEWNDAWVLDGVSVAPRMQLPNVLRKGFNHPALAAHELQNILQALDQHSLPQDMPQRITLCEQALNLVPKTEIPELWAQLQGDLGNSFAKNLQGSRADNLERAISSYEQALTVLTREAMPSKWATIKHKLALAYYARMQQFSI